MFYVLIDLVVCLVFAGIGALLARQYDKDVGGWAVIGFFTGILGPFAILGAWLGLPFKYALRKVLLAIPLVIGVLTIIFVLLELAPGDASSMYLDPDFPEEVREMVMKKYGLDKPAWQRYLLMLKNLAQFDFGNSFTNSEPVWNRVAEALPNTILLSTVTLVVAYPLGIVMGIWQAVRQGKPDDTALSVGSLMLYSMPSFWFAMMLQLFVAFYFSNWILELIEAGTLPAWMTILNFDVSGMYSNQLVMEMTIDESSVTWSRWIGDVAHHTLLPGVAMGVAGAASTARYMRSSLLEVIRQDYIRTARAKGLAERVVILRHAMRNALLPIITLIGLSIPYLFSGSVLIEKVFAWPGMGQLIVDSIFLQDTPTIIACFFVSTLLVVAGNLIADLSYAIVDPRIRYD